MAISDAVCSAFRPPPTANIDATTVTDLADSAMTTAPAAVRDTLIYLRQATKLCGTGRACFCRCHPFD
ncbi:hypothetical protein E2562_003222 [Oryza meyeriana var. granulata]|uniref:Uncharacterized protein n=1 Tax=Oryza meyeriana var. granulata TaxID=110450 RepID=A0A6G1EUU5_9ORYZ|nr:hypothetical protein E2562_003222 [Oryza meyeriana var. granulata]